MKRILSKLDLKVGTLFAVSLFMGLSLVLALAPRVDSVSYADGCGTFANPVFNPFPVTYGADGGNTGTTCNDFPTLSGNVSGASQWAPSFSASAGQTITLRVYIHNGAASNSGAVMDNVAYNVNLDSNPGSTHTVTANLTASNATSISGSVTINTDPGDSLELVSGNLSQNIGNLQPCFEYAQSFLITLKVVGPVQPAAQSFNLSVNPTTFCSSAAPTFAVSNATSELDGQEIFWSSTYNGQPTGENLSGYNQFVGSDGSWSAQTNAGAYSNYIGNWTKTATIYAGPGTTNPVSQTVYFTVTNCAQPTPTPTPTPVTSSPQSFSLTVNPTTFCSSAAPTFAVSNATSGLDGQEIFWTSTYNGQGTGENLSGYNQFIGSNGTWSAQTNAGAYSNYIGSWTKTATIYAGPGTTNPVTQTVYFTVTNCAQPTPTPTPPVQQSFNFSVNPTSFCSTAVPTFTVTNATSGLFGKSIYWSSTFNGNSTGENLDYYGDSVDGSGNYSAQANSGVYENYIGNWTKTITVYAGPGLTNPVARTVSFTVNNCAQPTPTPTPTQTLSCTVTSSSPINSGATASFVATGGSYPYNWIGGQSPASGTGSNFSTSFTNNSYSSLTKIVTVSSGDGQHANCAVTVNPAPPTPTPTPTPTQAIFTATATATASASASASCPSGATASASASATASATASSSVSQQDAQNQAQAQAQSKAQAQAYANAQAQASVTCPAAPTPTPTPPVCQVNSNFALNASSPSKQGSAYSVVLTWSTTGNNQIKLVQVNPDGTQSTLTTGNASGSFTATGLQQASNYIFKIYDVACGNYLTSTEVSTPANPGQLICFPASPSYNVGATVSFSASGGSGGYSWSGSGSPASANGSSFGTSYSSAGTQTVSVTSGDGQTAQCSVVINQPQAQSGVINLTKMVEDITTGTGFSHSVNASTGDTVEYQIQVSDGSSVTLNNVLVTDTFAQGLSYMQNSLQVNGQSHATGLTGSGLTFPTLSQSNPITITYQATVTATSGSIINTAAARADNGTSASDQALVNVSSAAPTPTPTPAQTGNCNNDSNSCNTNTNTNTGTNSNSANSSNQNNNNNINGNSNTVTNTNNNCVNNSCNTVYITTGGSVVPANQFSQLSITKMVMDVTHGGGYQNSVTANNGDTVQFQIIITNTGSVTANNVSVTDPTPSGLSAVYNSGYYNNSLISSQNIGNLAPGSSQTLTYSAQVNSSYGSSIQNIATATASNSGSVQASAWVFINNVQQGCTYNCNTTTGTVSLGYSKTAFNNTKNTDATAVTASSGDSITYTLTVQNSGTISANNFIITDDLSQVLPYASIVDNGGGTVSGNVISFPGITVPAGGSVSRSFKVQVNTALASNLSYVMTNTYGNTITIRINTPEVLGAFTAPTTGADTQGFMFATVLTAAAAVFGKRKYLMKLIFA